MTELRLVEEDIKKEGFHFCRICSKRKKLLFTCEGTNGDDFTEIELNAPFFFFLFFWNLRECNVYINTPRQLELSSLPKPLATGISMFI